MISTSTSHKTVPFSRNRLLQVLVAWYAVVWIATAVSPLDRHGFSRNHFDRIAHFSFGLLMAYPIREVFLRVANARGFWAYYLPLDVTLAFSALYEIMEMVIATMVAPRTGDAWLGTQGDVWDAQKDMGLAALGALLCMCVTALIRKLRAPRPVLLAGVDQ